MPVIAFATKIDGDPNNITVDWSLYNQVIPLLDIQKTSIVFLLKALQSTHFLLLGFFNRERYSTGIFIIIIQFSGRNYINRFRTVTTEERPLGVYHPRPEYHHIKKENIGLIEVMGLAVLPSRLKKEMESLADCLVSGKDVSSVGGLEKHADWVKDFLPKYAEITQENVWDILKEEIGEVFVKVLEDAGVYKCTEEGRKAFERFINTL